MRFLPVGLDVRGRRCLVVGGGAVGSRKVANLLAAGADVTVVSPVITEVLSSHVCTGRIRWIQRRYSEQQLEGVFLVVAATDARELNGNIVQSAAKRGVLVCDASSAERSQVIFGAIHDREGDVTIAVFTDGRDPAAARRTRDRVAELLDRDQRQEDATAFS